MESPFISDFVPRIRTALNHAEPRFTTQMQNGLFWMNPFTRYFFFKTKDITGLRRGFLIIIDFGGSVVFSCCGSRLILLYVNEARSGNWFRKLLNQDSEPVKRKNRTLNTGQNIEIEN